MMRLDTLKQSFLSSYKRVKVSLHRWRWKETLTFFGFVFVSFSFWMLISLQKEYETKISLPIHYSALPADIILPEDTPSTLTMHVKDKGNILFRYSFMSHLKPIVIDRNQLDTQKKQLVLPREYIETALNTQLIPSTVLLDFFPKTIETSYELRQSKRVPILFDGDIRYNPGFQQSEALSFSPSELEIYGSEETLANVDALKTKHFSLSNVEESIDRSLEIEIPTGIISSQKAVDLHLPVEAFMQAKFDVPIVCSNLPDEYSLRIFPSSVSIECAIPLSKSKDLSESDFAFDLDFKELEQNMDGVLPVSPSKQPHWLSNIAVSPKTIEFIIEYKK